MRSCKTIVTGIDFSPLDELSIATAGEVARYFHAEHIHLVNVASPYPRWAIASTDGSGVMFESAFQAALDGAKVSLEGIRPPADVRVTREVRVGRVAHELANAAEQAKADLVVVASHPRGRIGRFALGSVASTLVRTSPCPVLVVGADRPLRTPLRNVLAAIDTSPVSAEVVAQGASFARPGGGRVRVLSCFDLQRSIRETAELRGLPVTQLIETCEARYSAEIQAIVARAGVTGVETVTDIRAHDDAKKMIMEAVEELHPDLIAIGTSGHNAWERFFLGATASHVLAEAPCPVLIVPQR